MPPSLNPLADPNPEHAPLLTVRTASISFTQGFLLGQLSVVALLILFIKFFIFGDAPPTSTPHARRVRSLSLSTAASPSRPTTAAHHAAILSSSSPSSSVLRPTPPLTTPAILAKTYYNVPSHQPESVDWFNVLVAQSIAQLRDDAARDGAILASLAGVLNGPRRPDWLDHIRVTDISLGEEFPIFSNCRVIPVDGAAGSRPGTASGEGEGAARLQARMDVDLADALTLAVETRLLLNYPRPCTAAMPVALAVSVVRFSGTLSISFIPSPAGAPSAPPAASPASASTSLTLSFQPDYRLELSTHSLLGSRSRLQDVPKIAQVVEGRLSGWFEERCVAPRFQEVALPSFWPRRGNTRGGGDGVGVGVGGGPGLDGKAEGWGVHGEATGLDREREGLGPLRRRREEGGALDAPGHPLDEGVRRDAPYRMPGALPSF